MKNIVNLCFVACLYLLAGCSGSRKTLDIPFAANQYRSDETFVRGTGMGKHLNKQMAYTIALTKAREALGGNISTLVKQQVTELKKINGDAFDVSQFEETSKTIVDQSLNSYEIMDQKTIQSKDGKTEIWIVLQMARSVIDQKLQSAHN